MIIAGKSLMALMALPYGRIAYAHDDGHGFHREPTTNNAMIPTRAALQ
jgi:hypothetical protein